MYEEITFESIVSRMLEQIPSDFDKREGSLIYDALAPCAIELQLMYIELDVILKETFGDTASRSYLIRRANERGLSPYPSTYAVLRGEFNMDIPIGSRFSCDELTYIATEQIETGQYYMKCETLGVEGNRTFGTLVPIDYIKNLTSAKLLELLIPAEDEEETENFRTRYLNSFNTKSFGGNVQDYLDNTNGISGVGATKVTPVWNGGGTVRLCILDAEYHCASVELVDLVQQTIDPTKDGYGVGIAPIGHVVTVVTAEEVAIDIQTSLIFSSGYHFSMIHTTLQENIQDYLLSLRKNWADEENLVVRLAQIEAIIINLQGVEDIIETKLNGISGNFTLTSEQIPVLGVVTHDT